jgi:hypothetical protein
MSQSLLPSQFADLEPLASGWALATQRERERKRAASTVDEMRSVYDTLLPRLEPMLDYLNQFTLDNMPEDARRLFYLTLSFAEVAPYVECYGGQPSVPNSFEETRFIAVHGDRVG